MWQSANFGALTGVVVSHDISFFSYTAISSEGIGDSTVADNSVGHVGYLANGALIVYFSTITFLNNF